MQTENLNCFFRMIHDKMASHNLPSVTEFFFKECLSQSFALLQVEFCNMVHTLIFTYYYLWSYQTDER